MLKTFILNYYSTLEKILNETNKNYIMDPNKMLSS